MLPFSDTMLPLKGHILLCRYLIKCLSVCTPQMIMVPPPGLGQLLCLRHGAYLQAETALTDLVGSP